MVNRSMETGEDQEQENDTELVKAAIQEVRLLEANIRSGAKNANDIVKLRKILTNKDSSAVLEARIAAIHALRRSFIYYAENGWCHRQVSGGTGSSGKTVGGAQKSAKLQEYNQWFLAQYRSFLDALLQLISDEQSQGFHAISIRTYLEMMKFDHILGRVTPLDYQQFNTTTFRALLKAIVVDSGAEIDVDLLLMLKEEIFTLHDCTHHGLVQLKELMDEFKDEHRQAERDAIIATQSSSTSDRSTSEIKIKNFIDLMRVIEVPDLIDEGDMLLPEVLMSGGNSKRRRSDAPNDGHGDDDNASCSDSDGNSSDDSDADAVTAIARGRRAVKPIDPLLAELAGLKKDTMVDAMGQPILAIGSFQKQKRKRSKKKLVDKLVDRSSYQKLFSKAWLSLLSLPFSTAQHKVLLRHLPQYVVPNLLNPLLLADYLTASYKVGGVVAVLALESLFQLILQYNLDYPDFFLSLYNLCTVQVFTAKYRSKFMPLLNSALKSVNIPMYLVAAFIKRLARLALHTLTPNAQFCLSQCIWLLRQHPQSQVLIHRISNNGEEKGLADFCNHGGKKLEDAGALQSSLWELELLRKHHLHSSASLAEALAVNPLITMTGEEIARVIAKSYGKDNESSKAFVHVEDYLDTSYDALVKREMGLDGSNKKSKQKCAAALAYKTPKGLFGDTQDALLRKCFG